MKTRSFLTAKITVICLLFLAARCTAADKPNERVNQKDGAVQVYVPGGKFVMGYDDPESPLGYEQRPAHTVQLKGFWMDKYEVTNEQFAVYLNRVIAEEGKTWNDRTVYEVIYSKVLMESPFCGLTLDLPQRKVFVRKGWEKFPVMPVRWFAANEYARKIGKRLPTEAEWEYAAGSSDGKRYPWGNTWDPKAANVGTGKLAPIGSFSKDVSPFGIMDMGGNVREWVQDKFDMNYYAQSPKENPVNNFADLTNTERVIRGGSYAFTEWDARVTSRTYYHSVSEGIAVAVGFRTVEDAPAPTK